MKDMWWICTSIVILCSTGIVRSYNIKSDDDAMMYLNRFGYVNDEDMTDHMYMGSMKPMVMEFQKMCSINQTGVLDTKTMEMMNSPRCGNLDVNLTGHHLMYMGRDTDENEINSGRYRRYLINENKYKWTKRELTYKMGMFSQKMGSHVTKEQVLQELHKAFKLWSEVTNLDFYYTPNSQKVDIEISFTLRYHEQDQYPFDGPGNTLAHAFPPGPGLLGDVHFEDEETWTIGNPKGINVLFVAVHEIGHALGLSHSMVKGAIMQPFYGGYREKLRLHEDDIAGIQSLYGKREKHHSNGHSKLHGSKSDMKTDQPIPSPPPTTTTMRPPPSTTSGKQFQYPPNPDRPSLCDNSPIDAITTLKDGSVYVFKGDYTFQIDGNSGEAKGSPHRVDAIFKNLPGHLDAAVTRKNGKTYFFKDKLYWRYAGTKVDSGYPQKISQHFPGIPDRVDSAFEWFGGMYFIKGDKVWRFDPKSKPFVSKRYPISLSLWELDVRKLDAVLKAPNGHIYFFSDQHFWKFDEKNFKVEPNSRKTTHSWFGCMAGALTDQRNVRHSVANPAPILFRNWQNIYDYGDY